MRGKRGFSMIELLVVMSILGTLLGVAALNLRPLNNDAQSAASNLTGFIKQTRARAMATTSAYRLDTRTVGGKLQIYAESAARCNITSAAAWTEDPRLRLELPDGVTMRITGSNGQPVCFSSRGMSNASIKVELEDNQARKREVEVLLGGAVRSQP